MNTIPTTSKRLRTPYTVVGGKRSSGPSRLPVPLSILLLNRGGRPYKTGTVSQLEEIRATEIISVEGPAASYDVESLSKRFPGVKFLLLRRDVSVGEKINMGIHEAAGRLVLVVWNDMLVGGSVVTARLLEKVDGSDLLCTVPVLLNQRKEPIPTIMAPAYYRKRLKVIPMQPVAEGMPTLFPFDYCGIYSKDRFTLTGGYDHTLSSPYWQKLDFGFRSHMWGERIVSASGFRVAYQSELPPEDATPDEYYRLFFLKNLAIRFSKDSGRLPLGSFFQYLLRSRGDIVSAVREFRQVKEWVQVNRYRFRLDAKTVTELWETHD